MGSMSWSTCIITTKKGTSLRSILGFQFPRQHIKPSQNLHPNRSNLGFPETGSESNRTRRRRPHLDRPLPEKPESNLTQPESAELKPPARRRGRGAPPPAPAGRGGAAVERAIRGEARGGRGREEERWGDSHGGDAGGDLVPEGVDEGVEAGERVQLELRRRLLQHRQQRARRAHRHRRRRHVRGCRSAAAGSSGVRRRVSAGDWISCAVGGRVRFAAGDLAWSRRRWRIRWGGEARGPRRKYMGSRRGYSKTCRRPPAGSRVGRDEQIPRRICFGDVFLRNFYTGVRYSVRYRLHIGEWRFFIYFVSY